VKRVAFNEKGTQVVCITEQRMGHQCAIRVFEINSEGDGTKRMSLRGYLMRFLFTIFFLVTESKEPLYMFNPIGSKATVCAFTLTPNVVISGHESGKVALFNVKTGEEIDSNERAHSDVVTDLQMSKDWTYCITSSKDKAARVGLFSSVEHLKIAFDWTKKFRYTTPKISWSSRPSILKLL
jgi:translation initiation factor 3 subunit I